MKIRSPLLALTLFVHPTLSAVTLNPVIVTATRSAQTADQALASVTVISAADIERQQAQSVQELLRGVPGVSLSNNGGPGKNTSVFMRGTESDHVLVLIDGVKVGSATLGTTAFQDLPVEQIERIEVVRGPRSSLYGSEAIGGVIQIFTRKGGGQLTPSFSIGGGRYDTYNASAGLSGGGDHGWFNASISSKETNGFNACNGIPGSAGCFTSEPDSDGYRNLSGSLRAGYRFDNGLELDAHVLHADTDNKFDGSFTNESEGIQQVIGASLRFSPTDRWLLTLAGGRSKDESDNFKDGTFSSQFESERDSLSWQNDISLGTNHLLTLGADYQKDSVDGTTAYAVTSRDNDGAFVQYQGAFKQHDLQLSLRNDDNEQFGQRTTGGAAWGYSLGDGLRLTAAYGTAFKAPTFNELFFPFFGNPALDPEESRSLEIGLSGGGNPLRWSVNLYETRVDELISFDANTFAPANISKAVLRGLELTVVTRVSAWDLNANLSIMDTENRSSGANDGNWLARRPQQALRVDADRQIGKYRIGSTLIAEGKRYDDLANNQQLGGFITADLRAEMRLQKHWRLQAKIENLLDKNYATAAFFNQPGRSLFVTLRYQP